MFFGGGVPESLYIFASRSNPMILVMEKKTESGRRMMAQLVF